GAPRVIGPSPLAGVLVLHAVADLAVGDLLERDARRLFLLGLDLRRRAPIELTGALGGEDDEQVTVGHLLQRLPQRRERHQSGTSMSGNLSVSRLVRQRSPWMMVASRSTASFTSRLMIR